MPLSNYARDTYIAPGFSTFTEATIPDLSKQTAESEHWISNFVLNSILRYDFPDMQRQFLFNYLRRAQITVSEYEIARQRTMDFLGSTERRTARYLDALHHWEVWLGSTYNGLRLLWRMAGQRDIFEKGDGSQEENLCHLYNALKHAEGTIESGQMPPSGTVPVWLTNEGLQGIQYRLSYEDVSELVEVTARYATALMDPATAKETLI